MPSQYFRCGQLVRVRGTTDTDWWWGRPETDSSPDWYVCVVIGTQYDERASLVGYAITVPIEYHGRYDSSIYTVPGNRLVAYTGEVTVALQSLADRVRLMMEGEDSGNVE